MLLLGSTLNTGSFRSGQTKFGNTETKGRWWGLYGHDVRIEKVCLKRHEVTAAVITFESGQNPSRKFWTLCLFDHISVVILSLALNLVSLESVFIPSFHNHAFVGWPEQLTSRRGTWKNVLNFSSIEKNFSHNSLVVSCWRISFGYMC